MSDITSPRSLSLTFTVIPFFDDIRLEVDGKLTFVGAYPTGTVFVKTDFPVTVPKFCFGIFFIQK